MNAIRKKLLESKLPDYGELLEVYKEVYNQEVAAYNSLPYSIKVTDKGIKMADIIENLREIVFNMEKGVAVTELIIKS